MTAVRDRGGRRVAPKGGAAHERRRLRRSELEAFYRVLAGPLIRRLRWSYRISDEDARDIVQEAFVLALERLGSEGNAAAWLTRAVDRLAANFVRTGARRAGLLARWASDAKPPAEESEEIET